MKGKFAFALCSLIPVLLMLLAMPVSADWNPGDPFKWLQAPDQTTTGMDIRLDSSSTVIRGLADDFQCTATGPITDVHFWGSWRNDIKGRIAKLRISIFADVPDPDGTGPKFSQPGQQLWTRDFTAAQFTERLYSQLNGDAHEWWWDPYGQVLNSAGDQKIYQYNIKIDPQAAFVQSGTAAKPVIYWLGIGVQLDSAYNADAQFGWKTRSTSLTVDGGGHFQDAAIDGQQTPAAGNVITKLTYPDSHPFYGQPVDLAFVVTTTKFQPDLLLRTSTDAAYIGDNIYSADGSTQVRALSVPRGSTGTYYLRVQNDGAVNDSFAITAPAAPAGWTVTYYSLAAAADVTAAVLGSGWSTGALAPGATSSVLAVKVTPTTAVTPGTTLTVIPKATSLTIGAMVDVGQLKTTATGMQPDLWLRTSSDASYIGDNIYSNDGATQIRSLATPRGTTVLYYLRVQNDGTAADSFTVKSQTAPSGWTVKYYSLATSAEITTEILSAAGWSTGVIATGANVGFYVRVTPSMTVVPGTTLTLKPWAVSTADATKKDMGQLKTTATGLQPDLWLRTSSDATFIGDNIYSADGATQSRGQNVPRDTTALYYLRVQNDGSDPDEFWLKSQPGPAGWTVKYYTVTGDTDVTGEVTGDSGWLSGMLDPGAFVDLYVKVIPTGAVTPGAILTLTPTLTSAIDPPRKDVGKLVTKATGLQPDLWLQANGDPAYSGLNIYSADGATQNRMLSVPAAGTAIFYLRVQNDGITADTFSVKAPAAPADWTVSYYSVSAAADVTAAVNGAGWSTGALGVGAASGILKVKVKPGPSVLPGAALSILATATSAGDATKIDVGKITTALVPYWNPGDPYKWLQMPDLTTTGMDIRVDNSDGKTRYLGDDFQCTSTDPITDIHFWGSWRNDVKGKIAKLHVSIFSDIPDSDGTGPAFSKPGDELWTKVFTADQITERLYKQLPTGQYEWWWDPVTQQVVQNGDTKVYQYNLQIDPKEAFVQQGSEKNPVIYWLVISVELDQKANSTAQFGWKTRDWNPDRPGGGHFLDDAAYAYQGATGGMTIGELRYPTQHPNNYQSLDLAFVLTTRAPVPAYQPDGSVSDQAGAIYFGDNIYNLDGTDQMATMTAVPGEASTFLGRVQNDGNVSDKFVLTGPGSNESWSVKYTDLLTFADITAEVTGTGKIIGPLAPGATWDYRVDITPAAGIPGGSIIDLLVNAASVGDPTKKDVVLMEVVW